MATITEIIPERCETCGVEKEGMQQCSKCKVVRYCSRDCQMMDWRSHKQACKKQETLVVAIVRDRCESCRTEKSGMNKCGKCRSVQYCSTACQRRDWGKHKQACKAAANTKTCIVCNKRDASVKPCPDCHCDIVTYCSEACKTRDALDHGWKCVLVKAFAKGQQFAERVQVLIGGHDVCTIAQLLFQHLRIEQRPVVVIAKIIGHLRVQQTPTPPFDLLVPSRLVHGMTIEDGDGNTIDVILSFTRSFPHFHFNDIKEGSYVLLFNPTLVLPSPMMLLFGGEEPDLRMDEAKDVKILEL